MRNFLLYSLVLLCSILSFSQLSAKETKGKESADVVKETKSEIRQRLSTNVSENKYGDVLIALPSMKSVKAPPETYLPKNLAQLALYIFPSIDLDDMYKIMSASGSAGIDTVVNSIDRFLGARNARLKATNYSQGSVRLILKDGLPLFAYMTMDEDTFPKIVERCKARFKVAKAKKPTKTAKNPDESNPEEEKQIQEDIKEWLKTLKKDTQKRFSNSENTAFAGLISGYNPATKEYQISSVKYGTFWILESELKASMLRLYELRF